MKAKIYHPSCDDYMTCLQRGGGPYYGGSIMQRGYGIGGLFRGLATTLLPLLPKVGNFVAKTVLGVASDKLAGIPLSKAVKKRSTAAGKKLIMNALPSEHFSSTFFLQHLVQILLTVRLSGYV